MIVKINCKNIILLNRKCFWLQQNLRNHTEFEESYLMNFLFLVLTQKMRVTAIMLDYQPFANQNVAQKALG